MEGFDINKIKVIDSRKQPSDEELLTGNVVKGLDPNSPIKPNSEIETGEYIQFPDGVVQKVVGEKHEKGGVKMNIPDGTKIVSDHLTLTKTQAKTLSKEYDIDFSTKDTYATVLEKYTKKIGLAKLNSQQEDAFAELKKERDKETTEGTARVNNEYLSSKIKDLEDRKSVLEKDRKEVFDKVFEMQEISKKENPNKNTFELGGTSMKNFEALCKQYGMSPDQGLKILKNGGYNVLPKYADGDVVPTLTDEEKKTVAEKWNGNTEAYLSYKKASEAILSNPDLQADIFKKYQTVVDNPKSYTGEKKKNWESALKNRTQQEVIDGLLKQEERNARLAAFGFDAKKTSQNTTEDSWTNKEALQLLQKEPGLLDINFEKGYIGQAAYLAYDETMRSDKYKKNYLINQTGVADERGNTTISGIDNANTNTTLGQRLNYRTAPDATAIPVRPDEVNPPAEVGKEGEIKDLVKVPAEKTAPRLFFTPDQSALVPSPMEAHLKNNIRLQRIDPIAIGIENNLQAISDERRFVSDQLKDIPDSQRAAALASLLATSQKSTNQAITAANITNAQNQTQAEQFNIGQAGQEELYAANNALDFEQRQLTAKAKTEEALNRYYDYNKAVNVTNFQNNQKLNLMDSLYPNFNLDFMGASVSLDPNSQFTLEDRRNYLEMLQNNQAVESQFK